MRKLIFLVLIAATSISISAQSRSVMNSKVFEAVWSTVNAKFYDPNFNGVDWQAVHTKYAPIASAAVTDEELYKTIMEMLGLLKVSHMEAGPASDVKKMTQKVATVGIGLRMVEGKITVTRLVHGFPAEAAGIKPGYIITAVDGAEVSDIEAASHKLSGPAETSAKLSYLDERDEPHTLAIRRQALSDDDRGKIAGFNFYSLFDSKTLDGGIGYIKFSSFVSVLNGRITQAITSFKDAPGLIIDLRGNGGGDDSVALVIANRLFDKPTLLMITKRRKGDDLDYKAKPTKPVYHGNVVVLMDELSGSASEQLAAGLQEIGRAYVIGKKSAGSDMDADLEMLPDGGMLIYASGLPRTPKGVIVEGRGVVPDLEVDLHRSDLLAGRDTQLQTAIDYLTKKKLAGTFRWRKRREIY